MVLAGDVLFLAGCIDALAIEMKTGRPLKAADPDPRENVFRAISGKEGSQLT